MIQECLMPLRTLQSNATSITHVCSGGQYSYDQAIVCSTQDMRLLQAQIQNVVSPLAPGQTIDNKFLLESANYHVKHVNTSTSVVKITCFWLKPQFDLFYLSSLSTVDPLTLLAQGYGGPVGQVTPDTSPISYTDLDYDIYQGLLPHYWKVYKRKTVILMPGTAVHWDLSVGKKVINNRRLNDPVVGVPNFHKRFSRSMLFQYSTETSAATTTTNVLTQPVFSLSFQGLESYKFRAMIDPRPVVSMSVSVMPKNPANAPIATLEVNPITGAAAPTTYLQGTPVNVT